LNLLSGGQTYPYLGHCITRGISLRRLANIFRLGGVVRFWAAGVGFARGATSGSKPAAKQPLFFGLLPEQDPDKRKMKKAPTGVESPIQPARAKRDGHRNVCARARRAAAPVNAVGRRGPIIIRLSNLYNLSYTPFAPG
jgi:hypothetical protein